MFEAASSPNALVGQLLPEAGHAGGGAKPKVGGQAMIEAKRSTESLVSATRALGGRLKGVHRWPAFGCPPRTAASGGRLKSTYPTLSGLPPHRWRHRVPWRYSSVHHALRERKRLNHSSVREGLAACECQAADWAVNEGAPNPKLRRCAVSIRPTSEDHPQALVRLPTE